MIGKIFEDMDWLGKCIGQTEVENGNLLVFLRYSSHHNVFSVECILESTFKEYNYQEVDFFPEELPKVDKIVVSGSINC